MLRSWREERDAKDKEEEALANRSMNNIIKKYNKIQTVTCSPNEKKNNKNLKEKWRKRRNIKEYWIGKNHNKI